MNDNLIKTIEQLKLFLDGTEPIEFTLLGDRETRYQWVAAILRRFDYHRLRKRDKSLIMQYMLKITGYSRQQMIRLIAQHRCNKLIGRRRKPRNSFKTLYTRKDILLLAQTDEYHNTLSGPATKKLFERAYLLFNDTAYKQLAGISVAHIYNLRKSLTYTNKRRIFNQTKRTNVAIGERRKPQPNGQPGYLRIDTVHQGDQDKRKGVYHINVVDEVTQMEVVYAVEKISEFYLIPVLEQAIEGFPFVIKEIHSDNGSEYINIMVARLLKKLLIELTKSRARHSNDNALVESKNGSIIRKHLGYFHIQQKYAEQINSFYKEHFNPYVNYHRPCFFPVTITDKNGKERKTYPYGSMMTPYEKFKSLDNFQKYLKPELTITALDEIAYGTTDIEAAKQMTKAKHKLIKEVLL